MASARRDLPTPPSPTQEDRRLYTWPRTVQPAAEFGQLAASANQRKLGEEDSDRSHLHNSADYVPICNHPQPVHMSHRGAAGAACSDSGTTCSPSPGGSDVRTTWRRNHQRMDGRPGEPGPGMGRSFRPAPERILAGITPTSISISRTGITPCSCSGWSRSTARTGSGRTGSTAVREEVRERGARGWFTRPTEVRRTPFITRSQGSADGRSSRLIAARPGPGQGVRRGPYFSAQINPCTEEA